MRVVKVKLLGRFAVERGGQAVELHNRKDRFLLAYLCLSGQRPVSRSRLAGLLWGDRPEENARGSLRQSLAGLRAALRLQAGALAMLGRLEEAQESARRFLIDVPKFTISSWKVAIPIRDPRIHSVFEHAYRKAGLPE